MAVPPNLKQLRIAAALSMREIASLVGAPLHTWFRWERRNMLPTTHLHVVARALRVDVATVAGLAGEALNGRPPRPAGLPATRSRVRGDEDVRIPLSAMLALGRCATLASANVRARLGDIAYSALIHEWPRSSPHELLLVHLLLDTDFDLVRTSMRAAGAPMLIVGTDTVSYAGDERQLALLRVHEEERWLIFPEVRVRVAETGHLHRLDFVVRFEDREKAEWVLLEVDGDAHRFTPERDRLRTRELKMLTVRIDNAALREPGVAAWLTFRVRKQVEQARENRDRARRQWRATGRSRHPAA